MTHDEAEAAARAARERAAAARHHAQELAAGYARRAEALAPPGDPEMRSIWEAERACLHEGSFGY